MPRLLTVDEFRRSIFNEEIDVERLHAVIAEATETVLDGIDDDELGEAIEAIIDAANVMGIGSKDPVECIRRFFDEVDIHEGDAEEAMEEALELAGDVLSEDFDEPSLEELVEELLDEKGSVEVISKHSKFSAAKKKLGKGKPSKFNPFGGRKVIGPGPGGRIRRMRKPDSKAIKGGAVVCRSCKCGKKSKANKKGVCVCNCVRWSPREGKFIVFRRIIDVRKYVKSGKKAKYMAKWRRSMKGEE